MPIRVAYGQDPDWRLVRSAVSGADTFNTVLTQPAHIVAIPPGCGEIILIYTFSVASATVAGSIVMYPGAVGTHGYIQETLSKTASGTVRVGAGSGNYICTTPHHILPHGNEAMAVFVSSLSSGTLNIYMRYSG